MTVGRRIAVAVMLGSLAVATEAQDKPPRDAGPDGAVAAARPNLTTSITNLKGYWTRVFNCFTDSGDNRRVTTIVFGDSLGGRLAGWLQYQISECYTYGSRGRALGNAGPLWTGGWGPPSGISHMLYGPGTVHDVVHGNPVYSRG